jgi:hypothetical protein
MESKSVDTYAVMPSGAFGGENAGEHCRVCGHYHGGQGSCITRHAFVRREDCPTCVRHHAGLGDRVLVGGPR